MHGSAATHPPRVPRWLLLVALVLGVAGMHTLGHLGPHHGTGAMSSLSMPGAAPETPPVPRPPAVHQDPRALVRGGMPGLDPTSVCLAVLTSSLILLLLTTWLWRRRTCGEADAGGPVYYVARPPPRRTTPRLAQLSVLRT
jgi:hypothetical protein